MAKIFIVLSMIASVAAAYFGWTTYQKVGEVDKKLKDTRASLATTSANLTKTQDKLTDTTNTLTKTTADLGVANETIKTTQAKLDDTTAQLTTAQGQVTELTADNTKLKDQIKAMSQTGTNGAPIDPNDIIQKTISDLKAQLAESQQLAKTLQTKADDAQHRLDAMTKEKIARETRLNHPGIEGLVMAVNPGYNFTVISIGDHQGAAPNAQVIVKRGDMMIAKLKITSVEPTTSIADIIPDSVAKGMHVMPGDKVIFTGLYAQ